jgi:hypothetical protein
MKIQIQFVAAVAALCLAGCAASSIERKWKSPEVSAPVQKVAVIAVDERGMLRKGFENRFVRDLGEHQQPAMVTYESLGLPEIKADKKAATDTMRAGGADSVLIVRLVGQGSYSRQVEAQPELYVPVTTGIDDYYGWYQYYSVAFMNMSATWGSTEQNVYLDSSLHDLKTGKRLWSALTLTTVKDETDRLAEVDKLTAKVVAALRKDGLVR